MASPEDSQSQNHYCTSWFLKTGAWLPLGQHFLYEPAYMNLGAPDMLLQLSALWKDLVLCLSG